MLEGDAFTFEDAVSATQDGAADASSIARALLSQLTADERLCLLDGDDKFWPGLHSMLTDGYNRKPIIHGEIKRLGIPGVRFADGPRGCVLGHSTAFPVPMARGATWDTALEKSIGVAIGKECRAQGANFFGGVCVNLPRHPAWGRIQETYGEDPIILGELGAALTRGIQSNVMACVKHYALNSMENARFQVDVDVQEDVLHEVYLPHFQRIVDEGVAAVMSSYNSVRGEFAGQNKELLLHILRDQWGFEGFVMSDFLFGLRDASLSLANGLDIEAPFRNQRDLYLKDALQKGSIGNSDIDRACVAILSREIENAARRDPTEPGESVVLCNEHRLLARQAAGRSMVLLKNSELDGTKALPLDSGLSKVAVIGRLANSSDTGDRGSSAVRCPAVVSPYHGIKAAMQQSEVTLDDSDDMKSARKTAAAADVAILVVGYDWRDEGEFTIPPFKTNPSLKDILPPSDGSDASNHTESMILNETSSGDAIGDDNYGFGAGGDRTSVRLRPRDVEIITAASSVNPNTVVCIVSGGPVIMEEWDSLPSAILYSWYSGCEGGHALADLLLGRLNFSGHLPFSIPKTEEHLPFFDKDATNIKYDQWFGQRLLERLKVDAAYPLGFGLSYTTFAISDLAITRGPSPDLLDVTLKVTNTGTTSGRYIAQVYGTADVSDRPKRVLLGFGVIEVDRSNVREIRVSASTRPLQQFGEDGWEPVAKYVEIEVGGYWGDKESLETNIQL